MLKYFDSISFVRQYNITNIEMIINNMDLNSRVELLINEILPKYQKKKKNNKPTPYTFK